VQRKNAGRRAVLGGTVLEGRVDGCNTLGKRSVCGDQSLANWADSMGQQHLQKTPPAGGVGPLSEVLSTPGRHLGASCPAAALAA
jgi:hypothetical protein